MKKVVETLLTTPSARDQYSVKAAAYNQTAFTPWAEEN
jgi:hypothetical protein